MAVPLILIYKAILLLNKIMPSNLTLLGSGRAPYIISAGGAITDNFNRANENPLAGNWIQRETGGNIILDTNRITGEENQECAAYWDEAENNFTDDHYSEIELVESNASGYVGAMVRCSISGVDYYAVFFGAAGDDNIYVSRWDAGTETNLAVIPYVFSVNDILRVEVTGQATVSLVIKINGVQQGSTVNDNNAARKLTGQPGVWMFSNTSFGDNWEADNL